VRAIASRKKPLSIYVGGWQGLMQAALRHWFWILTGLMIAATGLWYIAGKA
jgi:hypothetical protein